MVANSALGAARPADVALSLDGAHIYVAGTDGFVRVYLAETGALVATWDVGTSLGGMDLSPDGSFLMVTETVPLSSYYSPNGDYSFNRFTVTNYKVDTATGQVTSFPLELTGYDYVAHDVAIQTDGTVLFTHRVLPGWSAHTPMRSLDLATGQYVIATGPIGQNAVMSPSDDGAMILVAESNSSAGPLRMVQDETFVASHTLHQDNTSGFNRGVQAYSDAGGLAALHVAGVGIMIYDEDLQLQINLTTLSERWTRTSVGGLAFDASGGFLFILDNVTDTIVQLSTADWSIVREIAVGVDFGGFHGDYGNRLLVGPNARYFTIVTDDGLQLVVNPYVFSTITGSDAVDVIVGTGLDDILLGNGGDDQLSGGRGNDSLDGGAGADSLSGGAGDDLYFVDDSGDVVIEAVNAGTDEVRATAGTYVLAANVEILTGLGAAGQSLTGNGLDNRIDGGLGADVMIGGLGSDLYIVDDGGDQAIEEAGAGADEVRAGAAAYVLGANIETLTGTSNAGQTLTGNAGANIITAGSGNDVIDGGLGADTMTGGLGNDSYSVDDLLDSAVELAGQGDDEIRTSLAAFTLGTNFEKLTGIVGFGQTLTGNGVANLVAGGNGGDVIDGAAGADTMAGGAGNDLYFADQSGDVVIEADAAGEDEVRTTAASFSLAGMANVERLTGSAADQSLTGNGSNNVIDGGAGADAMAGGGGHDVYIVDNAGDVVTELDGQGIDEIRTTLGSKAPPDRLVYVLPDFVENFTGTSAGAQGVRGNALDNAVNMGAGHDLIVLDDGGVDTVNGGGGNDYIYYGAALTAADTTNGGGGVDTIALLGDYASGITFTAANLIGVERLAVYTAGLGFNHFSYSITMSDANVAAGANFFVTAASLYSSETLFFNGAAETDGSFTILGGNGYDTIVGGRRADFLAGKAGRDTIYGLAGDDFIYGGFGGDLLYGGGGYDAFRYDSVEESAYGGADYIFDFTDLDRIDLSAIDANANGADGNSAFIFIGAAAFTNVAGQLRVTESGGLWTAEGDVNGDGVADLIINVDITDPTLPTLGAADFIL